MVPKSDNEWASRKYYGKGKLNIDIIMQSRMTRYSVVIEVLRPVAFPDAD